MTKLPDSQIQAISRKTRQALQAFKTCADTCKSEAYLKKQSKLQSLFSQERKKQFKAFANGKLSVNQYNAINNTLLSKYNALANKEKNVNTTTRRVVEKCEKAFKTYLKANIQSTKAMQQDFKPTKKGLENLKKLENLLRKGTSEDMYKVLKRVYYRNIQFSLLL